MYIIDSARWHALAVPADLHPVAAAHTHIGFFFAWLLFNDLLSVKHNIYLILYLNQVRSRRQTGARYIWETCSGQLGEEDVHKDAFHFMIDYYHRDLPPSGEDGNGVRVSTYLNDYTRTLANGLPTMYHVEDTWENYDLISPVLDAAWCQWRALP